MTEKFDSRDMIDDTKDPLARERVRAQARAEHQQALSAALDATAQSEGGSFADRAPHSSASGAHVASFGQVGDVVSPEEPIFYDLQFHQKRKGKNYRAISAPHPVLEFPLADTHCHLAMLSHRDLSLAKAACHGIAFICCVTDVTEDAGRTYAQLPAWNISTKAWIASLLTEESSYQSTEYAASIQDAYALLKEGSERIEIEPPRIRLACGCHPHNASDYSEFAEMRLKSHLRDERTSCLGEIGLDYHYDFSPRAIQQRVFAQQLELAHETGLPVELHIREAHDDALSIIREVGAPRAGVILHCCTLAPHELEPWLELGASIAYGGAITFNKLDEVRAGMRLVPDDKLLLETDCPYMAPVPLRGVENSPEMIVFTAERIAQERGIVEGEERREFLKKLYRNALALLDRPATAWQTAQ